MGRSPAGLSRFRQRFSRLTATRTRLARRTRRSTQAPDARRCRWRGGRDLPRRDIFLDQSLRGLCLRGHRARPFQCVALFRHHRHLAIHFRLIRRDRAGWVTTTVSRGARRPRPLAHAPALVNGLGRCPPIRSLSHVSSVSYLGRVPPPCRPRHPALLTPRRTEGVRSSGGTECSS